MDTLTNRHIVLGMAGHIDHGKTELVKALTGTDTDRLKEEKERGMTTDLGFAFLGDHITIIDVPGHEKFVKTMVAGVNTVDLALLVIAADDGVMPQTVEHLEILNLLGISAGLVALSKIDLVEKEWLSMVREDIVRLLMGTFLEKAPILPVSPVTGEGMDALKEAILKKAGEVQARRDKGIFRMPIDRVFTIKGFGTVVAGTILSGKVSPEDIVELQPQGKTLRVRGIQVHERPVDESRAGFRTAVNLIGVEKETIERGDVIVEPGFYKPTQMVDARFTMLKTCTKELKNRTRIRIHIGTSEIIGRIVLLDKAVYGPGNEGYVQLHFEKPVVADAGDRFVVRSYSPLHTIGGGLILETHPAKHRALDREVLSRLEGIYSGSPSYTLLERLEAMRFQPATPADLSRTLGIQAVEIESTLKQLESEGKALRFGKDRWISVAHQEQLKILMTTALALFHQENPLRMGVSSAELRSLIRQPVEKSLFDHVLAGLVSSGEIAAEGNRYSRKGHSVILPPELEAQKKTIEQMLLSDPFSPPDAHEIVQKLGASADAVLATLSESGEIVRIEEGVYLHRNAMELAVQKVKAYLEKNGKATVSDLKSLLGTTRKYAVPLLIHLDTLGITERDGDFRYLRE